MTHRIVIPTAGLGSRLGRKTRFLNKSLVSIDHKPVISHLIERFPADCEFIIALGYKGSLVREFLQLGFPEKDFIFVEVAPFEGPGSGLGHTLLCTEPYLKEPFIFASCDTLVTECIPAPATNWMGCSYCADLTSYRSIKVCEERVSAVCDKGAVVTSEQLAYIGLAGINDHWKFWDAMHDQSKNALDNGEVHGLQALVDSGEVEALRFTWYDTGSLSGLQHASKELLTANGPNILAKEEEAIWFINNRVIKFSADPSFIANRVKRSRILGKFVPQVEAATLHMYQYSMVTGDILSKIITIPLFQDLLQHCQRFWQPANIEPNELKEFQQACRNFYHAKTLERIDLFYKLFNKHDEQTTINGELTPRLSDLLSNVDWNNLAAGIPGRFHGDFHIENILFNHELNQFTFLDWRQDFGGNLEVGDIYYDLAKLLHGLIVSHHIISKCHYSIKWVNSAIEFDLYRSHNLVECENFFRVWCESQGYSFKRVQLLAALIFLNIASLHHHPYSLMLYALGTSMLKRQLEA